MAQPVIMPRQGQSVESCILTRWYKQKGEEVQEGDILFSFETDKAAFDQEAPSSGILLEKFYGEGDEVPVLANVAVIGARGENVEQFRNAIAAGDTLQVEEPQKQEEESSETEESGTSPAPDIEPEEKTFSGRISPRARKLAEQFRVDILDLKGTGPGGRIVEADVRMALERRGHLTPLSKRKAAGLQAKTLEDVEAKQQLVMAGVPETPPEDAEDIPLSPIRKIIAENTWYSLQHSAQLTHHTSAGAERILGIRQVVKPLAGEHKLPDITLNDLVSFAVIRTLKHHPGLNAHFLGPAIRHFHQVHLGIAVHTERGLMVPAVKNASALTVKELSTQIAELAEACRSGAVNPDLLIPAAATFTITNLGTFGIEAFTPVLNLPQVAILGVGTIRYEPVPGSEEAFRFQPTIGLSLTYDHRAVDGAPASIFLQDLVREIENLEPEIPEVNL